MLRRVAICLAGLALAAGIATAASAHMWGGGHHDRGDYDTHSGWGGGHHDRRDYDTHSGWYYGMSYSGY